jgi:KDO2-lipid IV(A) lauroyltransferase
MPKPRNLLVDFCVYLAVRLAVCVLQALPYSAGRSLMRLLARLAYLVDRRHREVAVDNLRQAFPGRFSEDELRRLVLQVYRHFATMLVEMVHLPRKMYPNTWRRFVELENGEVLVRTLLSGRPVLLVTGHYGNWEMGGYVLALFGFRSHAIARPLDNPYLDRFLRQFRERTGQRLIAKKGEFELIEQVLRRGSLLCTLGDQDAGQRGLFVDFFGRPASTHKAMAVLALEYQTEVLVAVARKIGEPMRYRIEVGCHIPAEELRKYSVAELTQEITTALERLIRRDVTQYFWLHRRWKHQPQRRRHAA